MKFEKNAKYNTYAVLALIVVAFAALLVSLAMHLDGVQAVLRKLLKARKNYEKKASALAVLCAYLLLLLVLVLAVVIVIPQFTTLYEFILGSTEYLAALDALANRLAADSGVFGERILQLVNTLKATLVDSLKQLPALVTKLASVFGNALSHVSDGLLGLIISIYAMLRRSYLKALCRKVNAAFFKPRTEERIADVCRALYNNTGWFFSARAYNSIAVAIVFYAVLRLLGCKFYSVLCLVIALCGFIPIFGMLLGGAIGALIVLITDTRLIGWFLIVFLVLMILDYVFLRPRITNIKVRVSLGTTMVCVLVGFFVWNWLGALFAIPLYVTARDFFLAWRKKRMTAYNGE